MKKINLLKLIPSYNSLLRKIEKLEIQRDTNADKLRNQLCTNNLLSRENDELKEKIKALKKEIKNIKLEQECKVEVIDLDLSKKALIVPSKKMTEEEKELAKKMPKVPCKKKIKRTNAKSSRGMK